MVIDYHKSSTISHIVNVIATASLKNSIHLIKELIIETKKIQDTLHRSSALYSIAEAKAHFDPLDSLNFIIEEKSSIGGDLIKALCKNLPPL